MTLAQALLLLGMLVDVVAAQQQEIKALQARLAERDQS